MSWTWERAHPPTASWNPRVPHPCVAPHAGKKHRERRRDALRAACVQQQARHSVLLLGGPLRAQKAAVPSSPHARHCTHALQRETVWSRRSFGTEVAAAEAYDMAALTLNGLMAPTNYDPDLCARPPRARRHALSKLFPGPHGVAPHPPATAYLEQQRARR